MLMETNTITYLARFIYRIRYKLFLGSIITCLLTIYFTKFLPKTYTVSTSIYTGIVSGGSINAETSMNWNETNNAFENIIQLIRSKKTLEQVSLRLLAQDLTYGDLTQDTRYISSENYKNLLKYTKDLTALVDRNSIEKTFQNLNHYLQDSPDNLIYRILSSERPFYSFHALNKISARRLGTSDILEIVYESSDPGITYNTIKLLTEELLKGYENIRFGASHDVIKYFEEVISMLGTIAELYLSDPQKGRHGVIHAKDKNSYYFNQDSLISKSRMDDFSIGDEVSFVITPNCDKVIHMKLEKHVEEHNLTEFAAPGLSRRLDLSRAAEDHLKPNSGELEVIQKLKQVLLITRIGHHYMDQSSLYQFCLASVTETFKQYVRERRISNRFLTL